jgi:hypothetical protein
MFEAFSWKEALFLKTAELKQFPYDRAQDDLCCRMGSIFLLFDQTHSNHVF